MKLCSKCNVNERVSYHTWCKACRKDLSIAYRKSYSKTYKREPHIYRITNIADGITYYGHTTHPYRWTTHKGNAFNERMSSYNTPIYKAIRAVCKGNSEVDTHFKFEILGYTSTKAEARVLELHLIKKAIERGQAIYNSSKATR